MDAPPIQYARTEDGVNIAYWAVGDGPPLVHLAPASFGHVAMEWEIPELRAWYEMLAAEYRLIRFDHRGFGLSDHDPVLTKLADRTTDLEAVIDDLDPGPVVLLGWLLGSPSAIRYAALHPDHVSHLILLNGLARAADLSSGRTPQWSRDMCHANWAAWSAWHTLSQWGWDRPETTRRWEQMVRQAASPAAIDGHQACVDDFDVTDLLGSITAPTLIAQQGDFVSMEGTTVLTSGIGGASLLKVKAPQWQPWWDAETMSRTAALMRDFTKQFPADVSPILNADGLRTLLFTDLESSTALTQSLGDAKAQEVLDGHDAAVRAALEAHGGEEVKHTGDGIFAAFTSAVSAVEAALQIQRELAGAEVRVRVGLNAGEPIAKDDDYFGSAVQLAARVCDRAEPGQVLVSNVVKELCTGKLFQFEDQGEATLKGFPEPVQLFVAGEGTEP